VDDEVLIAEVDDARNNPVNDASGLLVLADGRQAAESGELGGAEVQLDSLVIYRRKVKKCRRCLLFCGGCDVFLFIIYTTNITLISLNSNRLQRTLYLVYE